MHHPVESHADKGVKQATAVQLPVLLSQATPVSTFLMRWLLVRVYTDSDERTERGGEYGL